MMESHIYQQEDKVFQCAEASKKFGRHVHQIVMCIDLEGLSMAHRRTLKYMKPASFMDKNHYPEILKKTVMFNAPSVAPFFWKLVR